MRDRLKGLTEEDYWVYGITESDFDHAVELVNDMIKARKEEYERKAREVRASEPDMADDILDDVAYYTYIDNQYLWQFALWRLQGLLEAAIAYQLITTNGETRLIGLKSKLEALKSNGYTITQEEIDELLLWAKLRNALSHAPPEQYRPAPLLEEDVLEYQAFVKSLYLRWLSEKEMVRTKV